MMTIILPFLLVVLSAVACVTQVNEPVLPGLSESEVARVIPSHVQQPKGWAADIIKAITAIRKTPTAERVCAVVAVIEQESGYQTDPVVPRLPQIVREALAKKLKPLGILAGPALNALLSGKAPGEHKTFSQRIDALRTERDLDRLFRDIADAYREKMPGTYVVASALSKVLGTRGFENWNPVTTAGPMQVKVSYAQEMDEFKNWSDRQVREMLYTREGGIRVGTARLLHYAASYPDIIYRFADYNAGVYASRNAAFQSMLGNLTYQKLALDGDLLAYDEDGDQKDGETESYKSLQILAKANGLSSWTISRDIRKEKSEEFEQTESWKLVRHVWEQKNRRPPSYARMPTVTLISPKLQRTRSTEWFAENVQRRYLACRSKIK